MAKQQITMITDDQARALAQEAYERTAAVYVGHEAYRFTTAAQEAQRAVLAAYPADTFCVAREKPIHKAIRNQAREAANAATRREA